MENLPTMYAIPGQHDMPLHNIDLIEKSAFWTMCIYGKIIPITGKEATPAENDIVLYGFPFGKKLEPLKKPLTGKRNIALVHDYFWIKGHSYRTATKKSHSSKFKELVKGYHTVIFGDNHKGFCTKLNNTHVINCGDLIRRKADEVHYEPQIGLICKSGNILIHEVDTAGDQIRNKEDELEKKYAKAGLDIRGLVRSLREKQNKTFDYFEAIEFFMEKYSIKHDVREIILEALNINE